MSALFLYLQTLAMLCRALWLRRRSGVQLILPPVAEPYSSMEGVKKEVRLINRCTHFFSRRSSHACFYRSYPRAVFLRKKGVPVQFNIGLMGLGGEKEGVKGHCWLSLDETVVNELTGESSASYPIFLGESGSGVRYWVNTEEARVISHRFSD